MTNFSLSFQCFKYKICDKFEVETIYENKFFKGISKMEQKNCYIVSDTY